METTGIWLTWQ